MVSMSSSSCSVSNRFLNSSWKSIFFYPICVAPTLSGLLDINCVLSSLLELTAFMGSFPMLTWLMTVTYVTMSAKPVNEAQQVGRLLVGQRTQSAQSVQTRWRHCRAICGLQPLKLLGAGGSFNIKSTTTSNYAADIACMQCSNLIC